MRYIQKAREVQLLLLIVILCVSASCTRFVHDVVEPCDENPGEVSVQISALLPSQHVGTRADGVVSENLDDVHFVPLSEWRWAFEHQIYNARLLVFRTVDDATAPGGKRAEFVKDEYYYTPEYEQWLNTSRDYFWYYQQKIFNFPNSRPFTINDNGYLVMELSLEPGTYVFACMTNKTNKLTSEPGEGFTAENDRELRYLLLNSQDHDLRAHITNIGWPSRMQPSKYDPMGERMLSMSGYAELTVSADGLSVDPLDPDKEYDVPTDPTTGTIINNPGTGTDGELNVAQLQPIATPRATSVLRTDEHTTISNLRPAHIMLERNAACLDVTLTTRKDATAKLFPEEYALTKFDVMVPRSLYSFESVFPMAIPYGYDASEWTKFAEPMVEYTVMPKKWPYLIDLAKFLTNNGVSPDHKFRVESMFHDPYQRLIVNPNVFPMNVYPTPSEYVDGERAKGNPMSDTTYALYKKFKTWEEAKDSIEFWGFARTRREFAKAGINQGKDGGLSDLVNYSLFFRAIRSEAAGGMNPFRDPPTYELPSMDYFDDGSVDYSHQGGIYINHTFVPSTYDTPYEKVQECVVTVHLEFTHLKTGRVLSYTIPVHNEKGAKDYWSIRRNTIYWLDLTFTGEKLVSNIITYRVDDWDEKEIHMPSFD